MAATVVFSPVGNGFQWFGQTGLVLAGGKINTYLAGSTTRAATYTDNTGTVANANPIILDSTGRYAQEIWLDATLQPYKFVITDVNNVTQYTLDNLSTLGNAANVNYTPPGTGAITTTVANALNEFGCYFNVKQFGAKGDGVTDDTAAIQNCINALTNGQGTVLFPPGNYLFSGITIGNGTGSTWSTKYGTRLVGLAAGAGLVSGSPNPAVTLTYTGSGTAITIQGPINSWSLENLYITAQTIASTTTGLSVIAGNFGNVKNLVVSNFGTRAISVVGTATNGGQRNYWQGLHIFLPGSISTAVGIFIGTSNSGFDIFGDTWDHVMITMNAATHTGLYLESSDTITFRNLFFLPIGAKAIVFDYTISNQFPSICLFFGLEIWNNSITNVGTPVVNIGPWNKIYGFSLGNGASVPYLPNLLVYDVQPFTRTKIYLNAAQNIGNAGTLVTLDTKDVDQDVIANTTTHTITPVRRGMYRVKAQISAASGGASSDILCQIAKNGATAGLGISNNSGQQATATCEAWVFCNGSSDGITLVGQITGGATALNVGNDYSTWMSVEGPIFPGAA